MEKDCNLYIIFSSTPLKLGKLIRAVTHSKYNHISICTDEKLEHFYSFARYYKNAPLYGGFTEESALRYQYCDLKIFKLSLTREQMERVKNHIAYLQASEKVYIYNTFSALAAMFHLKIYIPYAYTCVEFAADILIRYCNLHADLQKFYSINRLELILEQSHDVQVLPVQVLSGSSWGNDHFPEKHSLAYSIRKTCKNFAILFGRLASN